MTTIRRTLTAASLLPLLACGGSKSTAPADTSNTTGNGSSTRTMTATANGVAFSPTTMISAYLNGQVTVNAIDATRSFAINALGVNTTGTISVAPGNANSAIVTWVDATGNYTSAGTGSGTVTFTTLRLGRVAGSFNATVKTAGSVSAVVLVGTFDIPFP